jgi:hypothetical protein
VKFLIDAQLPARLAQFLNRGGHDAVHTAGLPDGNRSTDSQIAQRADTDGQHTSVTHTYTVTGASTTITAASSFNDPCKITIGRVYAVAVCSLVTVNGAFVELDK